MVLTLPTHLFIIIVHYLICTLLMLIVVFAIFRPLGMYISRMRNREGMVRPFGGHALRIRRYSCVRMYASTSYVVSPRGRA